MNKNYPVQRTERKRTEEKQTHNYNTAKRQKKKKILKVTTEVITFKGATRLTVISQSDIVEDTLKVLKEEKLSPRILYTVKLSFRNEGK